MFFPRRLCRHRGWCCLCSKRTRPARRPPSPRQHWTTAGNSRSACRGTTSPNTRRWGWNENGRLRKYGNNRGLSELLKYSVENRWIRTILRLQDSRLAMPGKKHAVSLLSRNSLAADWLEWPRITISVLNSASTRCHWWACSLPRRWWCCETSLVETRWFLNRKLLSRLLKMRIVLSC